MKHNYRSLSVPVTAEQKINISTNSIIWVVEFPNGEQHIVEDKFFKQRFELTEKFTKQETERARTMSSLAHEGDCV